MGGKRKGRANTLRANFKVIPNEVTYGLEKGVGWVGEEKHTERKKHMECINEVHRKFHSLPQRPDRSKPQLFTLNLPCYSLFRAFSQTTNCRKHSNSSNTPPPNMMGKACLRPSLTVPSPRTSHLVPGAQTSQDHQFPAPGSRQQGAERCICTLSTCARLCRGHRCTQGSRLLEQWFV